VIFLNTDAPEG